MITFLQKNAVFCISLLLLAGLIAIPTLIADSHDDEAAGTRVESSTSSTTPVAPIQSKSTQTEAGPSTVQAKAKTPAPVPASVTSPAPAPQPAPTVIPTIRREDDD